MDEKRKQSERAGVIGSAGSGSGSDGVGNCTSFETGEKDKGSDGVSRYQARPYRAFTRPYLAFISPISRPYSAHIAPISRPYLAHISPI